MDAFFLETGMFRDALGLTRERTGFSERLIEKDYFCSQLLEYLAEGSPELVFKGGTCLAKVHADFYRLSEDLDFVLPTPVAAPRSLRSKRAASLRQVVAALPRRLTYLRVLDPLVGANQSTQYTTLIGYLSAVSGGEETIKVEVGLREPLLLPAVEGAARTLLLDPVSREPLMKPVKTQCLSLPEAFAEKFRAALSRREIAVRDFFDLDYAARKLGLRTDDASLVGLVQRKLAVPSNEPVDVSNERFIELRRQVGSQLQPVLRAKDFAEFDVERAFRLVADMASRVS